MKLVTPAQMREIDSRAIRELGIPSMVLMENAGLSLVEEVEKRLSEGPGKISVVCGPGNNGGDGLALARLLTEKKRKVQILEINFTDKRTDSYKTDRKSTRLNSSHTDISRMPSSA